MSGKGCLIVILCFLGFTMFGGVIIVALGFATYLIELVLPIVILAAIIYGIYRLVTKDNGSDKYSPKKHNSRRRKK